MNVVRLVMPPEVMLAIPTDYARFCNGSPVRLLQESANVGLTVRWDDGNIEFLAANGGVSF